MWPQIDAKLYNSIQIMDLFWINRFAVKYFLWCVPVLLKIICQPSKVHRQVAHKSCTFLNAQWFTIIRRKTRKINYWIEIWEKEKITCCSPRYFEGRGSKWNRTRQL
jgi:hypothetical protein